MTGAALPLRRLSGQIVPFRFRCRIEAGRGAQLMDTAREFRDHKLPALPFRGRNPGVFETPGVDAGNGQEALEHLQSAPGIVIAFGIMAVARVTALQSATARMASVSNGSFSACRRTAVCRSACDSDNVWRRFSRCLNVSRISCTRSICTM